jgi:hypothetical protein
MLAYLLAIMIDQAATEPPPALPIAAPPHVFLKPPPISCDANHDTDEVVVCGNKEGDARYRLKPIDDQLYDDAPIRAETGVAGGVLGVTANRVMVGGVPSNRVMLNFKLKF